MEHKFRFLLLGVLWMMSSGHVLASQDGGLVFRSVDAVVEDEPVETQVADADLEFIAERMKSLSGSLASMPTPPDFSHKKLQMAELDVADIFRHKKKHTQKVAEKKENL